MKYSHIFSLFLLLICKSSAAGFKPSQTFDYEVLLEEKGNVKVFWTYSDSNITFEVHAKTTGWVGFGISPSGGMKGADIAIGWVKDGKGYLLDTYAEGTMRPTLDDKQDLELILGREYQGITSLKFSRMLISCDTKHDLNIKDETNRLIFAWGSTDPTSLRDVAYHGGNRGSKSVHLLEVSSSAVDLPKDAFSFDLLNPNVTIPPARTTYWCYGMAVPTLDAVHHMIRVSPIITPGNEAMVHHILVYACDHEVDPKHHGLSQSCDRPMPGKLEQCSSIIAAWAIGGKDFDLPKHVGFPVGPGYGPKFLRMETHYDNPQNLQGVVDGSGLRVTLTKELRAESAGIIQAGHSVNPGTHIIPPHYPEMLTRGICPSKCITKALSNAGQPKINVFASVLHTHLMGRKISTRIIRDKKEVANIGVDSNYDFNFQEFRMLPREVEIHPNDTLVVDCVYDSSKRTTISRGGLGTQEEMCMTFLYYYPTVNLSLCDAEPTIPTLFNFLGVTDVDYTKWPYTAKSPPAKAGQTVDQLFPRPDDFQDSSLRKRWQDMLLSPESTYYFNCRANGQDLIPFGNGGLDRIFKAPAFTPADNNPHTAASCGEPFQPSESFPHEALLEETGKVMLYWTFTETDITFEVHARTLGWVGLGISPGGGMAGADIAIGWVKGGQGHLLDTYAEGRKRPTLDDEQNAKLLDAREYQGITALKFKRNLISCDSKQDLDIKDETVRLIFAWGSADPTNLMEVTYHGLGNRGHKSIRLLQPQTLAATPPSDAVTYEFLNPKVTIPSADTTYWCQAFKVPDIPSVHHLIKVSPIVQPGNEAMVHHILIYRCDHEVPDAAHGLGHQCYTPNMPYGLNTCNAVIISWAIGGGDFDFPDHVGFPVGPGYGPKFVLMETHYDNPSRLQGVVDNSGIRITLTPTLRPQNAGILTTGSGVSYRHVIPPYFPEMTTRSACSPDCWNEAMATGNKTKVTAFASMLHAHLLGRKIKTRVIRDGTEVADLGADNNYDFNFQEMRRFSEEVELFPNDTLITDCVYDSSARDTYTYGGLSTQEEMCLNFIYYYPAIPIANCQSRLSVDATFEFLGVTKWDRRTDRALEPADKAGKSVPELLPNASDWKSAQRRQEWQDHLLANTTTYGARCVYNSKKLKNADKLITLAPFAEPVAPAKPTRCFEDDTNGATGIPVSLFLIVVAMAIAA